MAKIYAARCIVKRDGKRYDKGDIIKDLSDVEIKRGLAEKWLEAVGNDSDGNSEKAAGKKPQKNNPPVTPEAERNALAEKAAALGIDITEKMTVEEIQQLITKKEAGAQ